MEKRSSSVFCEWPDELTEYMNPRVVGSGATACVYLAENAEGQTVAVKAQKKGSSSSAAAWEKECQSLELIRRRGCSLGEEVHNLVETFIPTCLGVGTSGQTSYYIMNAAGTTGIESKTRQPLDTQLKIFAQMLGAIYALHATGFTHNDLHGMNLVLDDENRLSLIDFGELAPHHSGSGYKHDINSVWKWTAQLAVCPSSAFPGSSGNSFGALRANKADFLACMKKNWDVDEDSLSTIGDVLEHAILRNKNQMLKEFWDTEFVQSLDANLKRKFAWAKMDGCLDWNWDEIKGVDECTEVSSFAGQCPIESRPGACYNKFGGAWSCWTDGVDFWKGQCQEQGYDGACAYKNYGHELKEDEIPLCDDKNVCEQQCGTKPGMYGACYTEDTSVDEHKQCLCVKTSNTWMITRSLLKGGCSTKKIPGETKTYIGVCRYPSAYSVKDKTTTQQPQFNVFGVKIQKTTASPTLAPGEERPFKVGDLVLVKNTKGIWKQATIHALGVGKVKVHFDGFHKRFDKFVPELSPDIKLWQADVVKKRRQDPISSPKASSRSASVPPSKSKPATKPKQSPKKSSPAVKPKAPTCDNLANLACASDVKWAFRKGRKEPWAEAAYSKIKSVAGVGMDEATLEDFHRLWHCGGVSGVTQCEMPPCSCSKPPCDQCA